MTQIIVPSGQSKCKRCGRWFKPKEPDQKYGPTCARKMKGQGALDDRTAIARQAVIV